MVPLSQHCLGSSRMRRAGLGSRREGRGDAESARRQAAERTEGRGAAACSARGKATKGDMAAALRYLKGCRRQEGEQLFSFAAEDRTQARGFKLQPGRLRRDPACVSRAGRAGSSFPEDTGSSRSLSGPGTWGDERLFAPRRVSGGRGCVSEERGTLVAVHMAAWR